MRLCTAIALLVNSHFYNKNCVEFILHRLPVVTPDSRDVVQSALTDTSYAELVHLFAASHTFHVRLHSYCCAYTQDDLHPYEMLQACDWH